MHSQKPNQFGTGQFGLLNRHNSLSKKISHTSLTHGTDSAPMFAYQLITSLHFVLTYLKNSNFGLENHLFKAEASLFKVSQSQRH